MFMKALDSMGKLDNPMFGTVKPDETVNVVFNLSKGDDHRGPWNDRADSMTASRSRTSRTRSRTASFRPIPSIPTTRNTRGGRRSSIGARTVEWMRPTFHAGNYP